MGCHNLGNPVIDYKYDCSSYNAYNTRVNIHLRHAFLVKGCAGDDTTAKTDSIWASLISVSLMNLILVLIYF